MSLKRGLDDVLPTKPIQVIKRSTRYLILLLMTLLAIGCGFLFPKININGDMTEYLPSDSRMREGLEVMKATFPNLDLNALVVKAMFKDVEQKDSLSNELSKVPGISGILAVSTKDKYTLFQLSVEKGADPKAAAAIIKETYREKVIVETNANSNMPDNMVPILLVGTSLVFGILFLMCSSFVEALLFLIAIGLAVVINMGTNAFLPSVSMMTNTIVAVLQLILSMDYSIILMNRYRQVLSTEKDIDKAMGLALKKASPSILSSSLTTIVGLLALVFMKFKIGMDLGLVLAKGVLCSLVSIYTILPALILTFDKGIKATEKKVFLIKTDGIAGFEIKFRIPLAILFLVIFICSCLYSQKTELSYASIWESRINEVFHPQNMFSIIYKTGDEDKLIAIADSIDTKDKVLMVLSYPSLLKKEHTVSEMMKSIEELSALLPEKPTALSDSTLLNENTLRLLFYASSHPLRDERMSFTDIMTLADESAAAGLLPEEMDIEAIMEKYSEPSDTAPSKSEKTASQSASSLISDPSAVISDEPEESGITDLKSVSPETSPSKDSTATQVTAEKQQTAVESQNDEEEKSEHRSLRELASEGGGEVPEDLSTKYNFTCDNINEPLTSVELAAFLGFSRAQASTLYSMAGKKGKKATMTAREFIQYMTGTVVKNKFLRKFISDAQVDGLYVIESQMDSVMSILPITETSQNITETTSVTVLNDDTTVDKTEHGNSASPAAINNSNTMEVNITSNGSSDGSEEGYQAQNDDPMGALAEFAASGRKVTAGELSTMLERAGIDIGGSGMVELLYMYYGSRTAFDESQTMSVEHLVDFLSENVAVNELYSPFIGGDNRSMLQNLKTTMAEGLGSMRTEAYSMAAVVTEQEIESKEVFTFIEDCQNLCRDALGEEYYLVGESVMYKEMSDGFKHELLILTLLTVFSIFLIVALTFKSLLIPVILVMTVMCGVYVNVIVSGIGDKTMLYLAYLIVQSILMGATIDYGILFTNYYLDSRRGGLESGIALKEAYRGSIHTIMTSGLIIICAPYIMSLLLPDPAIKSILSSLSFGAMAAILLILFILPATLATCDKLIVKKKQTTT